MFGYSYHKHIVLFHLLKISTFSSVIVVFEWHIVLFMTNHTHFNKNLKKHNMHKINDAIYCVQNMN